MVELEISKELQVFKIKEAKLSYFSIRNSYSFFSNFFSILLNSPAIELILLSIFSSLISEIINILLSFVSNVLFSAIFSFYFYHLLLNFKMSSNNS